MDQETKPYSIWPMLLGMIVASIIFAAFMTLVLVFLNSTLSFMASHGILLKPGYQPKAVFQHPWSVVFPALATVCPFFFCGSILRGEIKEHGWGILQMPAWIWPKAQKDETTFAVRLGRVLHWVGTALAAAALLLAILSFVESMNSAARSATDHAAWMKRHSSSQTNWTGTEQQSVSDLLAADDDPEPNVYDTDYGMPLVIVIVGCLLVLAGRGLRYIIAGE